MHSVNKMHWHGGWGKAKYTVPYGHWLQFYGSHFEKKNLKKEIVHIYLKGLEFQFQKKFNLTKCLKSLAENSIMTLLWSEKRARKLQEYSGTILHSPTGRLKRTAKGCFLYLNCRLELLMEQQVPKTHFDFSMKIKSFKTLLYGYFFNILSKFFISFFKFHFYLNLIKFFTFVQ